ncbi:hypothetical protein T05_15459 [Trichinella murrelli]|uniref:Uncharacterized protein n=1 Tax=Trichinella murrelli TaxID=144512 RepID=A0A0V0UG33_9BILA|nr:hypothetical protein T05_15459 [Trichinella murrelli]
MNRTCPKWFCPIDALSGNAPSELDTMICHSVAQVAAIDIPASLIDFFFTLLTIFSFFFSHRHKWNVDESESSIILLFYPILILHFLFASLINHHNQSIGYFFSMEVKKTYLMSYYILMIEFFLCNILFSLLTHHISRQILNGHFVLACFCHLTHLCHSSSLCCYNVRESHVLKQYSIFIPKLMHTVNFVIIIQESIFERSERLEKLHQVCCSLIHHKLALFPPDVKDKDHRDFVQFFEFFCLRNLVYEASFFFLQRSAFVFNHESMTSCKTSSKLFYSLAFSFSFEFAILISVKRMVKLLLLLHSGSQGGEWGAEVKLKNSSLGKERYHLESSERHYWWN